MDCKGLLEVFGGRKNGGPLVAEIRTAEELGSNGMVADVKGSEVLVELGEAGVASGVVYAAPRRAALVTESAVTEFLRTLC